MSDSGEPEQTKLTPAALIHVIMGVMIEANKQGMSDDHVFSAAITAIATLAKVAGHSDVLPLVLKQAMENIVLQEVTATKH